MIHQDRPPAGERSRTRYYTKFRGTFATSMSAWASVVYVGVTNKVFTVSKLAEAKVLFLAALAHQERGELAQSERLYRQALELAPDRPSVINNLAVVLLRLRRFSEAELLCKRLLSESPRDATAILNLGNCQLGLGSAKEALASFDLALAIKPDYLEALVGRSAALINLYRLEDALASCGMALTINPDYVDALTSRGVCLRRLGRHEEALFTYDKALVIDPRCAEALAGRGNALLDLDRFEEALASSDRALAIQPEHLEALNNRGITLARLANYVGAIATFERLLGMNPRFPYALGELVHAKACSCNWQGIEQQITRLVDAIRVGERATQPFPLLAVCDSPEIQVSCSRSFANHRYPSSAVPIWTGERFQHDRIRVAYLSADFHDHATAYLIAGLFERHTKARFELVAISFGPKDSGAMRQRLETACDRFIDVRGSSGRDVANLLRQLEIDIAIDLKGFTRGSRTEILAHRAAPIQVSYLGYPGTMGADYIDYIVADRVLISEEDQRHYTEKVVYLPDSYQANDSTRRIADVTPTRAEAGLPEGGFVFCSFNNSYKITTEIFDVWARLLGGLEGSVLWLLADNPAAVSNLRREAEKRGISATRLVFAARMKLEDHLARHRLADLFLDTLPYNAHTTASDALWSGLPVLTCAGSTFAGRVAASLLTAVDLPELVTRSLEEYEALASRIATTPEMLADIRARLARNRLTHPLFDTDRFRRHLEAAYATMWERFQRGLPPVSFAVAPIA